MLHYSFLRYLPLQLLDRKGMLIFFPRKVLKQFASQVKYEKTPSSYASHNFQGF
jgi:hypothetical protein